MKRICVFAGSNLGTHPDYRQSAVRLGEEIVKNGLELVYGGSKVGLMGEVANKVLEHGGRVIGVMPTGLFRGELVHTDLSELIEVKDMHERKAVMGKLADAYIALPGGLGTFEELFEAASWSQLGIHQKPIGVLNIADYYTPLIGMIEHAVNAGFVKDVHKQLLIAASDAGTLIQKLKQYRPPTLGNKWNQLSESDSKV
ncbi:LOG family protein [Effusibacillus dendaii]|uniref:Cytokinin riboside 5'-monophosphate phosphoribohydrolase n=1 Tax=Effusibacillus dendaii TaxID=2743772 RepID=A0A7I8DCJ4_9BACL|nr:TIGR00730 family Rossman fold protein [Effusibacillus dendaii]BCJ87072.1 cytokinin riboside 5'-monophosphate phosphoribohydrolase [Effusibacillus dendaii]